MSVNKEEEKSHGLAKPAQIWELRSFTEEDSNSQTGENLGRKNTGKESKMPKYWGLSIEFSTIKII